MDFLTYLKFLVSAAVIVSLPLAVRAKTTELAGRTVSMELIRASDKSPATWPQEEISLVAEAVIVKDIEGIFSLLEANDIQPDSEAYTIVYDLNPSLETLEPLSPGSKIILPKVVGGAAFQKAIDDGHLVMLTVDPEIKAQLHGYANDLITLSARFANLNRKSFADQAKWQETITFVNDLTNWFGQMSKTYMQHKGKPLRRVTLLQTTSEAEFLRSILSQALGQDAKLNASDQVQIGAIHRDVEATIKRWDEQMNSPLSPGEAQFKVVVNIQGGDQTKISGLRVYYVFDGQFRNPPSNPPMRTANFNNLGSGSSAMLPIKDYKIWAAPDGDPTHAVTPFTNLKVRRPQAGDTITLDLRLNQ